MHHEWHLRQGSYKTFAIKVDLTKTLSVNSMQKTIAVILLLKGDSLMVNTKLSSYVENYTIEVKTSTSGAAHFN